MSKQYGEKEPKFIAVQFVLVASNKGSKKRRKMKQAETTYEIEII